MANPPASRPSNTSWRLDLAVVILVTLCGTLALASFDAFEHLQEFLQSHEESELDEGFLGSIILMLSLAWFAWRRWQNDVAQKIALLKTQTKERKQAESAATASEAQLLGAIDTMMQGFALFDADERLVICNSHFRESLQRHDALGALIPGAKYENIIRIGAENGLIPSVYRDSEHYVSDRVNRFRNPSGAFEFQKANGQWIRTEERKITGGGTVVMRTNITASKRAEVALKESEARLKDAIDSMSEGFALFDSDERLVILNQPYRDTLPRVNALGILEPGVLFEDILRAGIENGFTPTIYKNSDEFLKRRLEKFRNPAGPIEYATSNGQWIRFEERKTSSGGTVGIRTDITARKQVEEALRASETNLRSIIDNYPYLITLKDLDSRYILVNDAYAKARNVTAEKAIGALTEDFETPS
jgi:PAS domain-containing protein